MYQFIFTVGILIAIVLFVYNVVIYILKRYRKRHNVSPEVVILYQIGRGPFAPSVSPFPLKLETFLRMTKMPYVNDHSGKFSSKWKTPWMEYNGLQVADSQFCIEYIKKHRGINVNNHLTKEEISTARAFQKMTEENLYWTMCLEMFGEDTSVVEKVLPYKGFKLWFTLWFLKRVIRKETWGHGIGRHTPEEVWSIAVGDLDAISHFLGDKKFFMGSEPSEVDCAMFGMLIMVLFNMPTSKHDKYVRENLPNIIEYCDRMKERYWPDWDQRIRSSEQYEDDDGNIYFKNVIQNGTSRE